MRELMKVIQQESYTYKDPITEFLECLYIDYDFEGAQQKLKECEEVRSAWFPLRLQGLVYSVCVFLNSAGRNLNSIKFLDKAWMAVEACGRAWR